MKARWNLTLGPVLLFACVGLLLLLSPQAPHNDDDETSLSSSFRAEESSQGRRLLSTLVFPEKSIIADVPDDPDEEATEEAPVANARASTSEGEDDDDVKADLAEEDKGKTYSRWPKHSMLASHLQPQLVGVGCQKCGTGSLFDSMKAHFDWVLAGMRKELHFFDKRADVHMARMQDPEIVQFYKEYLSSWEGSAGVKCDPATMTCKGSSDRVGFELTPVYMNDRRFPFVLYSTLPHASEVKILFILRNPSTRAYSGLFQNTPRAQVSEFRHLALKEVEILEACYTNRTLGMPKGLPSPQQCAGGHEQYARFHKCVSEKDPSLPWFQRYTVPSVGGTAAPNHLKYEGVVLRGLYADQIKNFLCAGFRPDQMIILTLTEFIMQEEKTLESIARFMGRPERLDKPMAPTTAGAIKNHRSKGEIDDVSLRVLDDFYRPHNEELFSLLFDTPGFTYNKEFILQEFQPKSVQRSSAAPLATDSTTPGGPTTTMSIRDHIKSLREQQVQQLEQLQARHDTAKAGAAASGH